MESGTGVKSLVPHYSIIVFNIASVLLSAKNSVPQIYTLKFKKMSTQLLLFFLILKLAIRTLVGTIIKMPIFQK